MATIVADKGADNIFELDVPIALSQASDKIWFTAKRSLDDLDADAVIRKGLNVAGGLSGITVTDEPNGKFQVVLSPADTASITDEALAYDVKVMPASSSKGQQVQRGTLRIRKTVTKATS